MRPATDGVGELPAQVWSLCAFHPTHLKKEEFLQADIWNPDSLTPSFPSPQVYSGWGNLTLMVRF